MDPLNASLLALFVITALLTGVWFIQLFTRNAGLVDVVWPASLGLTALLYAMVGNAPAGVRVLLATMALGWSLRLALYLAIRMRGAPEDARYAAARAAWGKHANLLMLLFFWFQALAAWVLALPFVVIAYRPEAPAADWMVVALVVALVSVIGEGLADYQLRRFKQEPSNRGKVCTQGLWRYSRHPNYFFESLHWCSYILLAAGAPYWWATLASPVIMAWLLLRVSGVPTIEGGEENARREGWSEYVRTTSVFIPLPPKPAR